MTLEVIDRAGARWRFEGTEWLRADYDPASDVLTVSDVADEGREEVLLGTFAAPVRWGTVSVDTAFSLPEKTIERCPKCGYGKV